MAPLGEIRCEGSNVSEIPYEGPLETIRDHGSFGATFLGAVFDHNLFLQAARASLGRGGPDGLLISEVPSVDVKAS